MLSSARTRSSGNSGGAASQQKFTVKAFTKTDTKKFTLTKDQYNFEDLVKCTRKLSLSQPLPENIGFYYPVEGYTVRIDDQESFANAVIQTIEEHKSNIFRVYIAPTREEADELIASKEQ